MSEQDDDGADGGLPAMADPNLSWSHNPETGCWEGKDAAGEVQKALCFPRFALDYDYGAGAPRREYTQHSIADYFARRRRKTGA